MPSALLCYSWDRDGLALVVDRRTSRLFPPTATGYQGPNAGEGRDQNEGWTMEIVGRSPTAGALVLLPKRWIVNACTCHLPARPQSKKENLWDEIREAL